LKENRVSALFDILDATLALPMWQICLAPDEVGASASYLPVPAGLVIDNLNGNARTGATMKLWSLDRLPDQ
jgi:hypothetical protein